MTNYYFCEICGKSFTWKHSLIRHQNSHMGKYPHNCRFCQKGFMNRYHLEGHEAKHLGITNLYRCTICFKVFSFSSGLQYHIKSVHESWICTHNFKILSLRFKKVMAGLHVNSLLIKLLDIAVVLYMPFINNQSKWIKNLWETEIQVNLLWQKRNMV